MVENEDVGMKIPEKIPSSKCMMACSGDSSQACGGDLSLVLYLKAD